MGEAKRKRASAEAAKRAQGAMLEQIRDTYFDMLGEPAQHGAPLNRPQLLGLLIEKAFLLDGFNEDEQNQLIALMEEVDRRVDEAMRATGMQPIGDVVQRVIARLPLPPAPQQLPPGEKLPIDPDRMRNVEERARAVGKVVGEMVGNLGFIVLLFETDARPELSYIANCDRGDCVNVLREFIHVLADRRDFPPETLSRRPN
jgi:hypothetical protein